MAKDLEIEQDNKFQKKFWIFQKFGMWFLFLFFIAAFTGLLGSGPLSTATAENDILKIEYPYVARFSHPENIKISISKLSGDTVKLIVNRDYISNLQIERIIPQPADETVTKNFVEFSFVATETEDMQIVINTQFRKSGMLTGEWGLKDKSKLITKHFIYP